MSRFCTIAVVALFIAQAVLATDYTYTGGGTGTDLWNAAGSWGGAGYPNSVTDTAYFTGAVAQNVRTDNSGPFKVGNITLGNGLGRTPVIQIGHSRGDVGLEIAAGATLTKKDNAHDQIFCNLQLDGATTFNVTPPLGAVVLSTNGITGPGGIIKDGTGVMAFEAYPNTYTGQTWIRNGKIVLSGDDGMQMIGTGGLKISAGYLQWWTGNHIADTAPVELGGNCELNPNGYAESVGALTLSGNAIGWGKVGANPGFHFANSSDATWTPGAMLTLKVWDNTTAAVTPKYYFGTDSTGLTATQLAQVQFADDSAGTSVKFYSAMFDPANPGLLIPVVHVTTFWSADFNHDLVVSFKDYIILEGNFGKSNATNAMGDADGDGLVTFKDYIALEGQFGKTSTPEPATMCLLAAGGLALLRRKA